MREFQALNVEGRMFGITITMGNDLVTQDMVD